MAAAGNPEQSTHGIILRTSAAAFSGRYAYFPLPRAFPTVADAVFAESLAAAPHFPNITILDSISSNILYQTYNSFPDIFHVYNLINRTHFPISFPYLHAHVTAAIVIHQCIHFKVLVVCIEKHPNPFFINIDGHKSATKPLVYYVYSSKRRNWSRIPNPSSALTSDQLLQNRRKPVHAGEEIVYLDLTDSFLVRFSSLKERVEPISKLVSLWEKDSVKLDQATRYGECRGQLHCAKFNPFKVRVEVYVWTMEPPEGSWRLVVTGKDGNLRGKMVLGLHPDDESMLFMRSKVKDEILMVDIQRDLQWVVIGGRGAKCGQVCWLKGMNEMLEAALKAGGNLQHSGCGILHPHENVEGPEGEVFTVSLSGTQLVLSE